MTETPSALRPRPGWERAANNPEASGIKIPVIAPSTGYTSTSYHPARGQPLAIVTSGIIDQSEFADEQQGHRLSRLSQPVSPQPQPDSRSARGSHGIETAISVSEAALPPTNARPAWDSRFHTNHTAWEAEPRVLILRPPSSNPFPGSDSSLRRSCPQGISSALCDTKSPRARRSSAFDGTDGGAVDGYGSRTTVLPGLYATSAPLRQSPYFATPGSAASQITPNASVGGALEGTLAPPIRPPRADIATSYVGQAYGPEQSPYRSSRRSCGGGGSLDGSSVQPGAAGAASEKVPDTEGDGGVDGRGTHLPALDRAYLQKPTPAVSDGRPEGAAASIAAGNDASLGPDGKRKGAGTRAKQGTKSPKSPTAVYLPKAATLPEPRAVSPGALQRLSQPRIFSSPLDVTGASSGTSPYAASEMRYQASLSKGTLNRSVGGGGIHLDHDSSALAGSWRPSGSQPIPDAPPPLPNMRRSQTSTGIDETQEEADRRRAAPRDRATYSPDRYPLVGQGWFLAPEKFPPNPAYADVKPRYMEVHTQEKPLIHIPDIHLKPWLTAGKHLVTDSSTPPPKVTGPAGARPSYSLSPVVTGTSGGTLRSTGRGTGRVNGRGGGGRGRRTSSSSRSGSGSEEELTGEQPEGELVAVIRGVRLMSIIRRDKMADEARLQAEEDAQFAAQEQEEAQRCDSTNNAYSEAHDESGAAPARLKQSAASEEQQQGVTRSDSSSPAGQERRFCREGSSGADRPSGIEGDVDIADTGAAEEDAEELGPGGAGASGGSESGGLDRCGSAASGSSQPDGGGGGTSGTDGAQGDREEEEEEDEGERSEEASQQGNGEGGEEEGYADAGGEEEDEEGLGDLQYQANAMAGDGEGYEEEDDVGAAAEDLGEGVADEDDE